MDKFSFFEKKKKDLNFSIGLFPGSRFPEILDNLQLILEVLEAMSNMKYFENIEFNFAIVNALSKEKIRQIFKNRKWIYVEKINENNDLIFQYKSLQLFLIGIALKKYYLKVSFVISMAGTATEQAIGLGKASYSN